MNDEEQWRNAVIGDLRDHLDRIRRLEFLIAFHGVLIAAGIVILIVKEVLK